MAEQSAQDVVTLSQSGGDLSPSDAPATTTIPDSNQSGEVTSVEEVAVADPIHAKENGIHHPLPVKVEDFEDASARSDTDTSRADGSVADDKDKPTEAKVVKKISAAKPVSFAKYSVPKVVAANAAAKPADRVSTPNSSTSSLQQIGRPRLVAKTTSSLQQKTKAYKPVAPDPMQVWNKNRVTPAPSTKHLTDEELKQQYGIHLTSRLQADAESKEAKWADIDDDEDDWAPETIEWNDGTKTTLAATDILPPDVQKMNPDVVPLSATQVEAAKPRPPQFASSVGPNATVLKLGASAERQQAQKAANDRIKSPHDKTPVMLSKTAPAPTPAKSPWAPLPPVDKVSPIAINPQPMGPPPARFGSYSGSNYSQAPSNMSAPSPAKEISADDFNRFWKNSPTNQTRELFMPSSGRYEAVAEGRRRMSKNDQSFRAPAVLQRPSQSDPHAPAEPSAAFQTSRTSTDVGRRRTSSIISGGSGQVARRLSIKSGDVLPPVFGSQDGTRPGSRDGPPSQIETPSTYHARGPNADYMNAGVPPPVDIEAERERQKVAMKERIEAARQRKLEEEARLEAEKKERIAKRLAALPPLPTKDEDVAKKAEAEVKGKLEASDALEKEVIPDSTKSVSVAPAVSHSPPKPPQPLATGEPQQYGLMKVHALDAVKKMGSTVSSGADPHRYVGASRSDTKNAEEQPMDNANVALPSSNGFKPSDQHRPPVTDTLAPPEPSPKLSKPTSAGPDARGGWGDIRDHRSPPSGNLWGVASNKALGNGTFDQGLAGYAPQDLSRTSSTAQGWMNGRTPVGGRSPQPQYATNHPQDPRANSHLPLVSPEQTPLAADSEADPLFPTVRPAPIAPPQTQHNRGHMNGMGPPAVNGNLAAWHNFHQVAGSQERAENERYQRELAAKREEEMRTGVRQGPAYTFNETWKQVQLGDQANQRHLSNVHQSTIPASVGFGAVGKMPGTDVSPRLVNGHPARGSRFFPAQANGYQERRAVTYSHPEVPRSPSPPPAEEYASYHPAFDSDYRRPMVKLPPEKPVVKLPSAESEPAPIESLAAPATSSQQPLTWAARAALPAQAPSPSLRSASTPIVQNPSWQERFNGLLGRKSSQKDTSPIAPSAVAAFTREPLESIQPIRHAAVSMPPQVDSDDTAEEDGEVAAKEVEAEVDLFEDRDMASLPNITLPTANLRSLPLATAPRKVSVAVDPSSMTYLMLTSNPSTRDSKFSERSQFALIRMPESTKSIKKDLPLRSPANPQGVQKNRNVSGSSSARRFRGGKSRQASKAH